MVGGGAPAWTGGGSEVPPWVSECVLLVPAVDDQTSLKDPRKGPRRASQALETRGGHGLTVWDRCLAEAGAVELKHVRFCCSLKKLKPLQCVIGTNVSDKIIQPLETLKATWAPCTLRSVQIFTSLSHFPKQHLWLVKVAPIWGDK